MKSANSRISIGRAITYLLVAFVLLPVAVQAKAVLIHQQGVLNISAKWIVTPPRAIASSSELQSSEASVVSQQPAEIDPVSEIISRLGDRSSPGVAVGAGFFIGGFVLFLLGLGIYARLHRRYIA